MDNQFARIVLNPTSVLFSDGHKIGPGRRTLDTYHRDHGKKWSGADLRAIRARNGCGRPPKHSAFN